MEARPCRHISGGRQMGGTLIILAEWLRCSQLEHETKVHTKVRNHGEGPYYHNGQLAMTALCTAPLKLRKIESSCLKEIPLQMLPMGMWGPENMKIKKFRWGLFDF